MRADPMNAQQHRNYAALLQIRAPALLSEAIGEAAGKRLESKSAYIRGAVLDRLREDGVAFEPQVLKNNQTPQR